MFTPEELAEMAAADAEIEESFRLTNEDLAFSRELDREAELAAMTSEKRKRAEYQKAYREANRDKVAAQQKAYYEANRDKVAAQRKAYREANRKENQLIGSEIKAVRKAFGYTQQYIAELLGVTKSAVSLWEKGAVPAPLDKLQAFLPGLAEKIKSAATEGPNLRRRQGYQNDITPSL